MVLALGGCAKQIGPTGGAKDVDPPVILTSEPLNESTTFSGNQLKLEFNEYVNTQKLINEMVVSPPLKYPVEVKMKGKTVTISWKDTLQENSTYMFQFGEGIADLNENNPLDSNVFVFSTGDYIDSLTYSGKIIDAQTLKPVEGVWAMLYSDAGDSLPLTSLPKYFSKSDARGEFQIRYIADGDYKLFALLPENRGYKFDVPTEQIGFTDLRVTPYIQGADSGLDKLTIKLFQEEDTLQFLSEINQLDYNGLQVVFNLPPSNYSLSCLTEQNVNDWTVKTNKEGDTITYWFDKTLKYDSLKLWVQTDKVSDTVFLRKPVGRKPGKGKGGDKKKLKLIRNSGPVQPYFKTLRFQSKTPLAKVDLKTSFLYTSSDTLPLGLYARQDEEVIEIDYAWKQGESYKILIPDSVIWNRFDQANDTILVSFKASEKEDYGQLSINHLLPDLGHSFVWYLIGKDDKVIDKRNVEHKGVVSYPTLETGKYQLKVVFDSNENGEWDSGKYIEHRQPEQVLFYEEEIEIRSNWQSEIDWKVEPGASN